MLQITVRQLLGMQSGLFDYTTDEGFVAEFDADPTMSFTQQQAVDIMKAHDPIFAPGEKTVYTDGNYVLLGMIIEKVTGRTAEDVINNDVVAKLGLKSTVFPTTATVPDPHPTGYVPDPNDPKAPLRTVNDVRSIPARSPRDGRGVLNTHPCGVMRSAADLSKVEHQIWC